MLYMYKEQLEPESVRFEMVYCATLYPDYDRKIKWPKNLLAEIGNVIVEYPDLKKGKSDVVGRIAFDQKAQIAQWLTDEVRC